MHRLRSSRAIILIRMAAILFLGHFLCAGAAVLVLIRSITGTAPDEMMTGTALAVVSVVCGCVQIVIAHSVHCPLCAMPPLARKFCQKNRRVRPLLGSYRMRASVLVVFRNYFVCPYCGEATRVKLKHH